MQSNSIRTSHRVRRNSATEGWSQFGSHNCQEQDWLGNVRQEKKRRRANKISLRHYLLNEKAKPPGSQFNPHFSPLFQQELGQKPILTVKVLLLPYPYWLASPMLLRGNAIKRLRQPTYLKAN